MGQERPEREDEGSGMLLARGVIILPLLQCGSRKAPDHLSLSFFPYKTSMMIYGP